MTATSQQFKVITEQLERAVKEREVPGVVAVAGTASSWDYIAVAGVRRYGGAAVTPDTRYDLASLSKVMSTLPAILRLVSAREIGLEDRLGKFFSNAGWFQVPSIADVSVKSLLTHSAGLPAWKPLFALVSTRQTALANVLQTALEHAPGSYVYSDLGFMLLGALIERVSGQRQDVFAREQIFDPLGMTATSYGPLETTVPVAASEDCSWRNEVLEGVVHDENAFVMDGVAGHAGLFAPAADVARYAQAWLNFDARLGDEALLRDALSLQLDDGTTQRGLGWVVLQDGSAYHTGFTGTSLRLDPTTGQFSSLLTNRVHPSRTKGTTISTLRQQFHDGVSALPG